MMANHTLLIKSNVSKNCLDYNAETARSVKTAAINVTTE